MMVTEVINRFAPFMMPLIETMVVLLEYFKQTMTDMTQFVFQTFVFPPIAFTYDTSSSLVKKGLQLVQFIRQYIENLLPGFLSYVNPNSNTMKANSSTSKLSSSSVGIAAVSSSSTTNGSTNNNNNNTTNNNMNSNTTENDSQASTGSNENYCCQSSFDGSSNTSIEESIGADEKDISEIPNINNNMSNDNLTNKSQETPETQHAGIEDNEDSELEQESLKNNFRQQFMDKVGSIQNGINDINTEFKGKVGNAWNGIKELQMSDLKNIKFDDIKDLTPKRLRSIGENTCESVGYYRREYIEYYYELAKDVVKNPMKVVEKAKEYAYGRYLLAMEYKEELGNWIEYGKEQGLNFFGKLREIFCEIRSGTFDYKQALFNITDFIQQKLTRFIRYCGSDSICTKVLDRLHVLGLLNQIKSYLAGPQIVHQHQN